jgi:calcium homeostasis ER protein
LKINSFIIKFLNQFKDQELRNIIDKLAQFVARNGPEFEQMTKDKQEDNPRFYFLFGGEFFNYYKFRVSQEQALIRNNQELQQQQQHLSVGQPFLNQQMLSSGPPQSQPPIWQNNGINNMNNSLAPNVLTQQINELQEQIRQSETNLSAQHQVLMQQQKCLIDEAIKQSQDEQLRRLAEDFNVNLTEFENVLQPIAENCTKESIAVCILCN